MRKKVLIREHLFKQIGQEVDVFENSRDAIGLAFFKFANESTSNSILRDFTNKYVRVNLE